MNFHEWLSTVPDVIAGDALWTVEAYRLALFAADLGWFDCTKLMQDRRTLSLSDQLFRAVGSVGANISEGYSRGSGKDRARFYEYSLGSSRESRHWYYEGRHVLGGTGCYASSRASDADYPIAPDDDSRSTRICSRRRASFLRQIFVGCVSALERTSRRGSPSVITHYQSLITSHATRHRNG